MNFDEWEPVYERILVDFGFERAADEAARDIAAKYATPFEFGRFDPIDGSTVAVVGAAPTLPREVDRLVCEDVDVVVAASTAADVLRRAGVAVDVMVTDLDKNPETARRLTNAGTPVLAHAHGDNVPAITAWLPQFDPDQTLVTTQAEPVGPVANFGGFTDGDRGAFLADAFGAAELTFVGWRFDDQSVDPVKRKKLAWAARLLEWLEQRRGERFSVLDGFRVGRPLEDEPEGQQAQRDEQYVDE